MTPKPELLVTDDVTDEMTSIIASGLRAFSRNAAGYTDRRPIAVIARDSSTGTILGGAVGRSSFGMLSLDVFYLPPELRGAGLGTDILKAFEREGRRRGCKAAVLHTISFQAPGFYERNGWTRFGEIACDPPGTSRIFFSKQL